MRETRSTVLRAASVTPFSLKLEAESPPSRLFRAGDLAARVSGRVAAKVKRMRAPVRSRGIIAGNRNQQDRFESIVRAFSDGYDAALEGGSLARLAQRLDTVDLSLRGFSYEGAGMALVTREALNPFNRPLLSRFISGPGQPYTYLLHVGAGWAFDLVPFARHVFSQLDPVLRWLAFDGMGFRDAFFKGAGQLPLAPLQRRRDVYELRAYDQGIGRCLWFLVGGKAEELADRVERFASGRHADLWAGIGLAVVYAGAPTDAELTLIRTVAGPHAPALAQGAAFAAKALQRGGQLLARHDDACLLLCGCTAESAARLTDDALVDLSFSSPDPAYELWRRRIQVRLMGLNPLPL